MICLEPKTRWLILYFSFNPKAPHFPVGVLDERFIVLVESRVGTLHIMVYKNLPTVIVFVGIESGSIESVFVLIQ